MNTYRDDIVRSVRTPAFVVDLDEVDRGLAALERLRAECGCRVLYALKPLACRFVLERMRGRVDGFAASSLFEAMLARDVLGENGEVHVTTPGFRPDEVEPLGALCDALAFNSLPQFERFAPLVPKPNQAGLRVNPKLSLVDDPRYDACRRHSKLGVPLGALRRAWKKDAEVKSRVRGLLFHNNCDATSLRPLARTLKRVERALGDALEGLAWFNLGGGYLFDQQTEIEPLARSVERLKSCYGVTVYVEPGASLVRNAGALITEVIDVFRSGGHTLAVLDTTVNHIPEVFEYQFEPDVAGHRDDGAHEYTLAGSSCLAGDVLGDYCFDEPLQVGSRVAITGVGAYSFVKAHMFNGINLPNVYSTCRGAAPLPRRSYTYDDFLTLSGANVDASVRA